MGLDFHHKLRSEKYSFRHIIWTSVTWKRNKIN